MFFLKGGARHNRNTGYKNHLTFLFLPHFSGSVKHKLTPAGREVEVSAGPQASPGA